jgi:hypothetical protein
MYTTVTFVTPVTPVTPVTRCERTNGTMNAKAKGTRAEHRSIKLLEAAGFRVIKCRDMPLIGAEFTP